MKQNRDIMKTHQILIVIISLIFSCFNVFSQELLVPVKDESNKWGYMNAEGLLKIPYSYLYAGNFSENLAYVVEAPEGSRGNLPTGAYVNPHGSKIIELDPSNFYNEYIPLPEGTMRPKIDNELLHFSEGMAPVCNRKLKWGFIDDTGTLVIPCIYDHVGNFSEGLAYAIILGSKTGYIDKEGAMVIELPADKSAELYQLTNCYYYGQPFRNGVAVMSTTNRNNQCSGQTKESLIISKKGFIIAEGLKDIGRFNEVEIEP